LERAIDRMQASRMVFSVTSPINLTISMVGKNQEVQHRKRRSPARVNPVEH